MTRLNYASRKSGGVELGTIVSRDLTEKFLKNPRPRVLNDPTIQIDLSNSKRTDEGLVLGGLADEGFDMFIDTLTDCLSPPHDFQVLELHLSGNKLTVKSLPALARVIELGSDCLRDLDLSNNELKVETKEEMETWEDFLKSFERCSMLKRLSLGGNPLGPFGLELLAKVYIQSPLIVERGQDGNPCTRGLRSIPYLVLASIDLTPSAIIHLASMLAIQQPRRNLRCYLPNTMPVVTDQEALGFCESIIWLPNETLHASKRDFFLVAGRMSVEPPEPGRRGSGVSNRRTLQSPNKNALSHLHAVVAKYSTDMIDEYFRYRKKICAEALSTDGIRCCVLWQAAFMTLKAGKIMLIEWQGLRSTQKKTYAAALHGCLDPYDQNFPALCSGHRPIHPVTQKLLVSLPSASRVILGPAIMSLKFLCRIPEQKWYGVIGKAVRTTGLLTVDQHLRIMKYAETWDVPDEVMDPEQIAKFLGTVGCLTYH